MKEVLLLRPDKAGDAIKTLPALRAARSRFPNTRFSILCSKFNASVFAFEPGIRTFELPAHWENLERTVLKEHLARFPFPTRFDSIVNLLCDKFDKVEDLLHLLPGGEKFSLSIGLRLLQSTSFETPEEQNIAHLLGQVFGANLVTGLESYPKAPVLSDRDRQEAFTFLGRKFQTRFGICPFAGTTQRSHSLNRWKKFLKMIRSHAPTAELYLFGTKADRPQLEFLRTTPLIAEILFPTSFRALGAFLETMDGVIAIDSGPLHLARALGVPSLGILSGGDVKRWFSTVQPRDRILARGLFSRHPTLFEMILAFRQWSPSYYHHNATCYKA